MLLFPKPQYPLGDTRWNNVPAKNGLLLGQETGPLGLRRLGSFKGRKEADAGFLLSTPFLSGASGFDSVVLAESLGDREPA